MKKVLAVTGTRADYGIYKPVFEALRASTAIDLRIVAVGMHLLQEFGHTIDVIKQDGFAVIAELNTMTTEDTPQAMAAYVARSMESFVELFAIERPDMVFVLGDRGEMLAATTAALYLRIPVAQLHAGEHSGSLDDPARHAITQMATVHFCTTEQYVAEVRRMCPNAAYVYAVGAPALDTILSMQVTSKEDICKRFGFDASKKLLLFVQHPDTTETLNPLAQLSPSLSAIGTFDGNILLIGSNADAGGMAMNAALKEFASNNDHCAFVISLPHTDFLSCESAADVLVGNSSSGIIEAASFGLPVVNVGERQKGRLRSGNVIDVPYDERDIHTGIATALTMKRTFQNIYGDGKAASRICQVLERITFP